MVAGDKQWSDLYGQLRALLSSKGKESPFGKADFWLVDDDWGTKLQKVCVFNIAFLTPDLVKEVQALLTDRGFADWGVLFSLELENSGQAVRTVPAEGITVYSNKIEEMWNRGRLRTILGDVFRW